ncbi:MAG: hypothetical protein AAF039_06535 [Bacteroidota bacterium]
MKIRIKGNSVRFRLTQSEVKRLCEKGDVSEQTNFGATFFRYAVKMTNDKDTLYANFDDQMITLFLPERLGKDWYSNEQVGFQHHQDELFLLLEKDFTCLDNTMEDQSDNYPNPKLMGNT